MILKKLSAIIGSIVLALFLLSFSIACPILIRGFYYQQIQSLDLVRQTGYSEETIREAYDEMMDYCTGGGEAAGRTFSVGSLAWSESGKAHFDDVERLFHLDFLVLGITGGILLIYILAGFLTKASFFPPYRFRNRGPLFIGPVGLIAVFGIVGALAAVDFDAFFRTFHQLFFPGKENWIFNAETDEIIRILPQEVFQNFGLIVLGILLAGCAVCIVLDFLTGRRGKRKSRQ